MNLVPHPVTEDCYDVHCHSHDVDEPWTDDYYRACYECGHVFPTEQALIDDNAAVWARMGQPCPDRTGADIHCCPHCVHDF